ncbi:MAG: glycosyl hydrolase-related protein [Armatimonadetes bacterium]|nr:glycosyl hydrolase-related protein [Armatimonadota bacterium]
MIPPPTPEWVQQWLSACEHSVFSRRLPITHWAFERGGQTQAVAMGFSWTAAEEECWLRASVTIPSEWAGERVGLWFELPGCEPLLSVDGTLWQALDYNHGDVLLHETATGGESHTLEISCYSPSRGGEATLQTAELLLIDREAEGLYYDALTAVELLGVLKDEHLRLAIEQAMQASTVAESRAVLGAFFAQAASVGEPHVTLLGHSHIDLAYLWAIPNTKQKVGRTFATALRLMQEFPEFVFTQSQPQLYAWCKALYPELYTQIKARVAEGRWEPTGGMWVEADCNLASGESLIRQVLFGNRFFEQEFGVTTKILWLPDVFGYSASLPQLMKSCGLEYFLTSKIAWSDTNRMPHDTFRWRGIDGTEVVTQFLTAPEFHRGLNQEISTYNGQLTPYELRRGWERYQNKDLHQEICHAVGHGDGGGGVTRRMLEVARRLKSIAGLGSCGFDRADAFFARLPKTNLPLWSGELYLENHRGTYTSQGRIKQGNRSAERALRSAELFAALAQTQLGAPYPKLTLDALWETLLLNQFHDILPGTCIRPAVEQAEHELGEVVSGALALQDAALTEISQNIATPTDSVIVFNPTDTLRPGDAFYVRLPGDLVRKGRVLFTDSEGEPLSSQFLRMVGKEREYVVTLLDVEPLGYQTIGLGRTDAPADESTVVAEDNILENDFVRVTLNQYGELASVVHKTEDGEREALAAPAMLVAYEDKPAAYDAWNIDASYRDKPCPLADEATVTRFEVIENGPVRASILVERQFRSSKITQRIQLWAHSARVELVTEIDWHEHQTLLKAHVPATVLASRATYEIPFGAIERPTHRNTSWDAAKFEVCGHKWADISEGDFGVSILSDTKYGYDARENTLSLTLIKSGIYPDPDADQGLHHFTYAVLPHTGDWRSETVDEAHALSYPLLARFAPKNPKAALPPRYDFVSVDDQGIIIETVKCAEADSSSLVVRLYEALQTRGEATLTFGFEIAAAYETNSLEQEPVPVPFKGSSLTFPYRPFEIKTLVIKSK